MARYHGDSSPSCGKTIHTACKTIALAITQAQWNDTIYIDGTETARDPYPCSSVTSYLEGIYVNISLSFERFGKDEVFLSCSSKRQMSFDCRNTSKEVLIRLKGLTFMNSQITVQKCSLYVESCLFRDAIPFPNTSAVVNFETFEEQVSLTIQRTGFSNNGFPCIRVVGSKTMIAVNDTTFINNTAIGQSKKYSWLYLAVFMVLLPTHQAGYPSQSFVTLTNTSFIRNTVPLGGCLHIEGIPDNQMTRLHNIKRSTKDASIVSRQFYSTKHDAMQSILGGHFYLEVKEGTFSHNSGRAITVTTISFSDVNISIVRSDFVNDSSHVGGAIFIYEIPKLHFQIEESRFVENSARSDGSAIFVSEEELSDVFSDPISLLVRVRDVLFLRNVIDRADNPSQDGGALAFRCPHHHLTVLLENVSFMYNKAAKGCSALCSNGYFQVITIVNSSFLENSQDERFSYEWTIANIFSYNLTLNLIRTTFLGNHAKPRAYKNILEGKPIHFLVTSDGPAQINISGLQYKDNKGGGIYVQLQDIFRTHNSTIFSVQDSYFGNNELFTLNIVGLKTHKLLQMKRLEFRENVFSGIISIQDSFFVGNVLFSLNINTETGNTLLQMKRSVFRGNAVVSSHFSSLPLFSLFSLVQGNQVTIEDAIFENNTVQARIVLFRFPPDGQDSHACNSSKWVYSNHVQITNVLFRENSALNSTVLLLESGFNILNNCRFIDNYADYTFFVGESSTSLELINTSFEKTPLWAEAGHKFMSPLEFRGFIYYAGFGSITLKNTTLTADMFQDIDSYFMVTGSSSAHIDNSSVIKCPIGTLRTLRNFTHPRLVSNVNCDPSPTVFETIAQSFTFSCKRCSTGFYSVKPFAERCRPCPYGGNCTSSIAAKPTFWGFPALSDLGSISFQQCPIDYCCPYRNISCPYDNHRYLSSGCSGNRTGYLCGKCKPGFTETLFSARCRASNDCTDYWFWPVAFFYTLAFGFFLLWKNPIACFVKRLLTWERLGTHPRLSASDSVSDGGGYIKVVFYFYQAASLVFLSKDIEIHLAENYLLVPVIGWFDFKAVSTNKGLICPIRGLTVVSKIFLQASQVFAVLFGILVIFLVHGAAKKLQKQSPAFPPSGQYLAATIDCLLLGYSTLARTALKALNCVPIQSSSRFFYDGNIQCWQWWQKLCAVFVCVFIIPFVFVLYRGSKLLHGKVISAKSFLYACLLPLPFTFRWMVSCKKIPHNETETRQISDEQLPLLPPDHTTRERSFHDPTHDVIYGPFKQSDDGQGSGAVYWESVLIGRRLILISLHTFIVFPFIRMVCLSVTCALILAHHLWKKPFKDPCVNHGETASLTALLVVAVINMTEVTFAISGEIPSEKERICFTVLHVVEVIVLGIVPLAFILIIFVSVLWQLRKFCKLCWVSCRLFVK